MWQLFRRKMSIAGREETGRLRRAGRIIPAIIACSRQKPETAWLFLTWSSRLRISGFWTSNWASNLALAWSSCSWTILRLWASWYKRTQSERFRPHQKCFIQANTIRIFFKLHCEVGRNCNSSNLIEWEVRDSSNNARRAEAASVQWNMRR